MLFQPQSADDFATPAKGVGIALSFLAIIVKDAFRMPYFSVFTHESFNVTVRLNTGAPGFESTRSATK
jgi:hypothetical protein